MYKIDYDELPPLVVDFLSHMLTIKGKSQLTVYEYYMDLRTFLRFLLWSKNKGSDVPFDKIKITGVDLELLKSVRLSDIYAYLNYVQTERGNSASTRARKVSSLRSFYKYLTTRVDLTMANPTKDLESPKVQNKLPRYLSVDESLKLLDAVGETDRERNYAILTLFLNCGMRLSELVGINVKHLNFSDNSLIILGKGNKERLIYLNSACVEAVRNYLAVRPTTGLKDPEALFLSRQKKRISPKTVQWLVKKYVNEAQLDPSRFSVHKLRHTAATLMYQNGTDLRTLQDVLGHESLGTTQIYTHVSDESLREAFDNNPLAGVKMKKLRKTKADSKDDGD